MMKKSRLLLGLLLAAPALAQALGLGDIRLASALNQPLSRISSSSARAEKSLPKSAPTSPHAKPSRATGSSGHRFCLR